MNTNDNIQDIYPLSPLQEGLLFHSLYDGTHDHYFNQLAFLWEGRLDIPKLQDSLRILVERYDILRTAFVYKDLERPVQVVLKNRNAEFHYEDIANLESQGLQDEYIESYKHRDVKRGFELTVDPLLRLAIFKRSDSRYEFIWSRHHIILDGWSFSIAISDFFQIYFSKVYSTIQSLPASVPQFSAYIRWLNDQDHERARAYWVKYMQGYERNMLLPKIRNAGSGSYANAAYHLTFEPVQCEKLRSLAAHANTTLNIVIQALWGMVLCKYSRRRDVVFGTVISQRPAEIPQIEALIGLLINTAPVRIQIGAETTFTSLLTSLHHELIDSNYYSYYPLYQLQAELGFREGFFESMMNFGNFYVDNRVESMANHNLQKEGIQVKNVTSSQQSSYPLNIVVDPSQEITITFLFDSNSYELEFIKGIGEVLTGIIASVSKEAGQPIFNLLDLAGNAAPATTVMPGVRRIPIPEGESFVSLFEAQARKYPDRIAVSYEDTKLTYRCLNEKSDHLAHYLSKELGVDRGTLTGLMLGRSEVMLIGILGVMKAGGCYVPIDADHPHERLQMLIDDAGISTVLIGAGFESHGLAGQAKYFAIAEILKKEYPSTEYRRTISPDDTAYVIFTSGSSGKPKGVAISHRAIVNFAVGLGSVVGVGDHLNVALIASFSFDPSVQQMALSLLYGNSLVILAKEKKLSGELFWRFLAQHNIHMTDSTPSYLNVFLGALPTAMQRLSLQTMIIGGEALFTQKVSALRDFLRRNGNNAQIINVYGPTECCINSTYHIIDDLPAAEEVVPIGRPLPNYEIHIVDDKGWPVENGMEGEILIGGPGVAQGYWNKPELTRERFIDGSSNGRNGTKVYRTGDYGKRSEKGIIQFLGRKDEQVKIRGYRIELSEIENVLRQHPAVSDAVVLAEQSGDESYLSAVLIPRNSNAYPVLQFLNLRRQGSPAIEKLHTLPNGLMVAHTNRNETDFLYSEIFEEQCYLRNGITIDDGDVIFDIGANIGMFALFVSTHYPSARVYCFEPIADTFAKLQANASLYKPWQLFNYGLGEKEDVVYFHYYPGNTAISGRYGNEQEDQEVIRRFLINKTERDVISADPQQIDAIVQQRIHGERRMSRIRRLSDVMHEQHIEKIDLLKIDVEKSELDVLRGIADSEWDKIRQIVIEVHDVDSRLRHIAGLLAGKGYEVTLDQDPALKGTNQYSLFAVRCQRVAMKLPERDKTYLYASPKALIDSVRSFCRQRLPDYMIPGKLLLTPEVPLTVNGKIDKNALRSASYEYTDHQADERAYGWVEAQLANIWREVLGVVVVGLDQNFFEIGGHSIKAIRVISRANQQFGIDLKVNHLFNNPTITKLAALVQETTRIDKRSIKKTEIREYYEVSSAQKRLWLIARAEGGSVAYNMPSAHRVDGPFDAAAFDLALQELVGRHEVLRTTFHLREGKLVQKVHEPGWLDTGTSVVDLRDVENSEQALSGIISAEANHHFDLEAGPLIRASIIMLSDHRVLLFNVHHIVFDGWSYKLLFKEMRALYQARVERSAHALPSLQLQYRDFAHWQNEILDNNVLRQHREYWLRRFEAGVPLLELPGSRRRPQKRTFKGNTLNFTIADETLDGLKKMNSSHGVTMFMTLVTLVNLTLKRFSRQERIIIGAPVTERHHPALEDQIGLYLNNLPIDVTIPQRMSFTDALREVKKAVLEAYEHQFYPFDKLIEDLKLDIEESRNPLYDVMIVLDEGIGVSDEELELGEGVRLTNIFTYSRSKLDLTFFFGYADTLQFDIEYNTALFDDEMIEAIAESLKDIMEQVLDYPSESVRNLVMSPEDIGDSSRFMTHITGEIADGF